MSLVFPRVRVGEPLRRETLTIFPLFTERATDVPYRLSSEALADQSVLVQEVSDGGSVPDLMVENKGDVRVLFLEGEELVGAKQNRVLNTSVLIAAGARVKIPVSCVEQGRWRYKSRYFGSSGSHSPSKLRRALKASVSRSVAENRGHSSDQGAVWREVAQLHVAHQVSSGTAAMSDAFAAYEERIASFRESLRYVDGAAGMAVAIRGQVVSVDLFDKPMTCQKVWDRLLSGMVFDALEARSREDAENPTSISSEDVERLIGSAGEFSWRPSPTVGEGEEFRAETPSGDHASALAFDGAVVHGSVLVAV